MNSGEEILGKPFDETGLRVEFVCRIFQAIQRRSSHQLVLPLDDSSSAEKERKMLWEGPIDRRADTY